ncbi:MAG: protein kinase [Pirellulaceae bacterium]
MSDIVDKLCDDFQSALSSGERPRIENALLEAPEQERLEALHRLLRLEVTFRKHSGQAPTIDEYVARFPDAENQIHLVFSETAETAEADKPPADEPSDTGNRPTIEGELTESFHPEVQPFSAFSAASNDDDPRWKPLERIHPPRGGSNPASESRFQKLKSHAQGGLGEVFRAEDSELNRTVALKEIQAKYSHDAASRMRFVLEAEVTGQLEHPGIVPIYSLGRYNDGRPYYAMRFIQGISLHEAIKSYHQTRPVMTSANYYELAMQQLLRRFIDVCHAIDYAHHRGVLHRDIKPANVMLGNFGETLVVDWGLAKLLDVPTSDSSLATQQDDFQLIHTQSGAAVGTPHYMSPEQASGQSDGLTPATDIYSLGATLFVLLTNQHAVDGKSAEEVCVKVKRGDIRSPRDLVPAIPAPLTAVCRRAMAFDPKERYRSASVLAEDIEHWLADDLVEAYRQQESRWEKAGRFLRRHRNWTVSVTAALLIVAAVSVAAAIGINQARKNEAQAHRLATQYKGEALDRYQLSRNAVDGLIENSEVLNDLPATQSIRIHLLEQAADDFAKLSAARSGDPELELERGRALVRLGDIYQMQERHEDARQQYADAADVFERDVNTNDPHLEIRRRAELANTHSRTGLSWDFAGHVDQAEAEYQQAVERLKQLIDEGFEAYDAQRYLATTLVNLAELKRGTGSATQAVALLEESLALYRSTYDARRDPQQRILAATASRTLADTFHTLGRLDDAVSAVDAAVQDLRSLAETQPEAKGILDALASVLIVRSKIARSLGDPRLEIESLEKALRLNTDQQASQPDVPRRIQAVAMTEADLGLAQLNYGDVKAAERHLEAAQTSYQTLVSSFPDTPEFQNGLAATLDAYGQTQLDLRSDLQKAVQCFRLAIRIYTQLRAQSPEQFQYFERLAIVTSHLAQAFAVAGNRRDAIACFSEATSILEQLSTHFPENPGYRNALAHVYQHNAIMLSDLSDVDTTDSEATTTAAALFKKASAIWEELTRAYPRSLEYQFELARHLLRSPDKALRDVQRASELTDQVIEICRNNPNYLSLAAEAISESSPRQAIETLQRVKEIRGYYNTEDLCCLACSLHQLGQHDDAVRMHQEASDWMNANRPQSRDLKRLLHATKARLEQPTPQSQ